MPTMDDVRAALERLAADDDAAAPDARAAFRAAADAADRRRARRAVRGRVLVAAAVVVVAGAVAALAVALTGDDDTPTRVATDPGRDDPSGPVWPAAADASWERLPAGPADGRTLASTVWTGSELIVWGGEAPSETTWHADGAAYDPRAGTWRDLAPAPLSARSEHAAVWSGDEMIVCCGRSPDEDGRAAAAYDPATDTWRPLTNPPVELSLAKAVWADGEMVVVGRGEGYAQPGAEPVSLRYDAATDSWSEIDPPPRWGALSDLVVGPGGRVTAFTDEVVVLDEAGWAPTCPVPAGVGVWPEAPSVVSIGSELLVFGSADGPGRAEVRLADLACSHPDSVGEPPIPTFDWFEGTQGSTSAVWTGAEVVVWTAALDGSGREVPTAVAYHPADEASPASSTGWRVLPDGPADAYAPPLLWADGRVVVSTAEGFWAVEL